VKLADLLDRRRVIVPLEAKSVREATGKLARTLVKSGAVTNEAGIAELLKNEWPEDVVMVGDRAFLPHFRTDAAGTLAMAIGVSPQPICRTNDPNRCAWVVVLIVAPAREASEYLRAMSAIARALDSDETMAGLHGARGPDDVLALTALRETAVPGEVTVHDLMTTDVTTVGPDTTLGEAARAMLARGVRAVPVTGPNGEVLGLLTDGHLLKHLLPQTVQQLSTGQMKAVKRRTARGSPVAPRDVPVREAMDRTVLCLAEDQTIADVAALMLARDVDRFPVTRDGALVGFLTRGDIVRNLLGY
jgi:CBS domain-containing protein